MHTLNHAPTAAQPRIAAGGKNTLAAAAPKAIAASFVLHPPPLITSISFKFKLFINYKFNVFISTFQLRGGRPPSCNVTLQKSITKNIKNHNFWNKIFSKGIKIFPYDIIL
jgi:hypothetical protein